MWAIKRFKDISSADVGSCGGKWASLGELMRAWFPFADGFVLTIEAFGKNHNEWADAVYAAYDQLNTQYVAVRSSATKEDGVDDSFAWQFDTYLFVNRETLIEQIMECHKSIDSPRIIAYCESKGINISEIKVAVVIQKMINSEVAGVAFTVNPVTNNRDEIMMEWWFWLGEAVVSGMITPDNYIWSKAKQSITDKSISHQTKKLVLDMSKWGTIEESVESTIQEVQKLSDSHITQLAQLSEKIEQHYGKPMDIEWALEDGKLYILQARPITTLVTQIPQTNIVPREKVLQRNFPVLGYTTGAYYEFHGIHLWPVIWKRDREIMATYHVPQVFLIQDPRAYYTTNVLDIIQDINEDFEKSTDQYNQEIYKAVRIEPGNSYDDLAALSEIHKLSYGLMLLWFDLVIDIKSYIDKLVPDQSASFLWFLETPIQKTAIQREQHAINAIRKNNAHNDTIELEQLTYDFGYIHQDYLGEAWTVEKYKELLAQEDALTSHMDESYDISHLSEYEQRLIRMFKKMVYMYEEWRNAMVRCMRAINKTSKKLGIDTDKILYMTVSEFEEMCQKQDKNLILSDELLAKRKEWFVAHFDNGIYTEYTGKQEVEKFLSETGIMHFWDKKNIAVDELKWTVAFPWYAIGRARLVFDQKDANAVQEWEILISPMTQVEFLWWMRRCGAIVTDEWGIICHAAIVAREFGKPCILSAKDATSAIKNGDLVEVDANMGVVRIVEKFQDNLLAKARKKNRAGRWSLLSCYYFGNHYTQSLQEKMGISLEEAIIIVHKWYSACYFLEEHKKKFGTHFAKMAQEDTTLLQWWSDKLIENTDIILGTIKELMGKNFEAGDMDRFLEAFYNYSVYHRIIKVSVDYLSADILSTALSPFEKARVYAEPVYENTEVYMRYVADALGKKHSIASELILATSPEQFADILVWKITDISVLQNQFESSVFYIHQGKTQYISWSSAQEFEQKLTAKNEAQETISGQTAYPGKVQWRVRIVLDPKPDTVFERWDILVTGMTRPEYLPLVEKSAAFVTDAGWILSHAAITARELHKPCVIGTEVASKILQDGDLVEVDADSGTVKILEKSDKKKDSAEIWQDYLGQKLKHMGIRWGICPLDIGTWYPVEVMENLYQLFWAYSSSAVICDLRQEIPTQWVFLKQNGLDGFGQRVDEIRKNDPQWFGKLLVRVYDTLDEVKKYFVSQDIGSIKNLSDMDLAQRFVDYRSQVHKLSVYDQIVWRNETYLDKQLHENIQSLWLQPNTEEYNKVLFALIMPLRPSTVMEEEQSVVNCAQSIQQGKISLAQAAIELAEKFGWLPAFVAGDEWWSDHYTPLLEKYISRSSEDLATASQKYVDHTTSTQALIHEYTKQYTISDAVLQICSDYALAIDSRNEAEYYLGFARRYLRPVCQTIAQRLWVSEEELRLLYEDEVPQCMRWEKNIHDILATRKWSYTAYCYDAHTQKSYTFDGDVAKAFLEHCKSTQEENKKSIHVAASKWVAQWVVRVLHGPYENDKVQPWDILITQSTTVDYLPAMKVCGAIITEVGWLTCHAAVVARELWVPCIVSYAWAMTEFKDGDLIEVDANTCLITTIKRA
jgi:phosphoenolpyruvate synthase/pyruvate phosphate dikinase